MDDLANVEMNQPEITKTVILNIAKMFNKRGYIKNDTISDNIIKEILDNKLFSFEIDGSKLSINFVNTDLKNIQSGTPLDDYLSKHLDYIKIVVVKSFSKKVYKQILENYKNAEIFNVHEFLEDISSKNFISEHKILSNEDKAELSKFYNLKDLAKIYVSDMMSRYYGAKLNDVFRIKRPNLNSGNSIFYRIVIPGNSNHLFE